MRAKTQVMNEIQMAIGVTFIEASNITAISWM